MRIETILEQKKNDISKKWFNSVLSNYAPDTATLMKNQKDNCANPVGNTVSRGLQALLNELIQGMDHETIISFLDPIIRIRAVQNFSASQAVAFIFSLKKIIRETITKEIGEIDKLRELLAFEEKIDELSLIAFNIYIECREKLFEIKANDTSKKTLDTFKRAGLISDLPDPAETDEGQV